MTHDAVAAAGFIAVVGLGLWSVAVSGATPRETAPRPVRLLILVAAGLSLLAGFAQRELWPFATWKLMADRTTADVRVRALVCVDSAGRSFTVDHRAWSPLTEEELLSWIDGPFSRLAPARQEAAAAALIVQVERARQRAARGLDPTSRPSILGRLAAPSHLLHPVRWTTPERTPASPCTAIRLVERRWNVDAVATAGDSVTVEFIWQHPAAR